MPFASRPTDPVNAPWQYVATLTILTLGVILLMYQQTVLSTVAIWQRSETFAHGFLIFPISAYLIWTQRLNLQAIAPHPDYRGLLLLAVLGFGWLFSSLGGVLVVAQYCMVGIILAMAWTLLGLPVVRAIAFPLVFLFFAVPVGEFLIPHLMNFTADFVVAALQITGIPVYREGTFFNIPSGQWSVVEGCSGLRYLIASITLGCLYAYLTYRSTRRRIIFTILALIVPVIANGLRAYMIVMIAHLSDMKLALGVDHYIYGWVFFGLVMLLLFWVGSFWREDLPTSDNARSAPAPATRPPVSRERLVLAILAVLGTAAVWPGYAAYLASRIPPAAPIKLEAPAAANGWLAQPAPLSNWTPDYQGSNARLMQTYRKDGKVVSLYLGYYRNQREGAKLITSTNVIVRQKHPVWSNVGAAARSAMIAGQPVTIVQTRLRSDSQRLLVWNWNRLGKVYTTNAYFAKLLEAKTRLLGQRDDAVAVILSTAYDGATDSAAATLQEFVHDMLPAVETSLKQAAAGA